MFRMKKIWNSQEIRTWIFFSKKSSNQREICTSYNVNKVSRFFFSYFVIGKDFCSRTCWDTPCRFREIHSFNSFKNEKLLFSARIAKFRNATSPTTQVSSEASKVYPWHCPRKLEDMTFITRKKRWIEGWLHFVLSSCGFD